MGSLHSIQFSGEESAAREPALLDIPFVRPNPTKLSLHAAALAEIERSGIFSNYGPVNTRLEQRFGQDVFDGEGTCLTVSSATMGLLLAIKQAVGWRPRARYALMPSFTFAAAAQAALWCGLTPLLCDVDPATWLPSAEAENALLSRFGDEIAILLPNATFGNCLDLARYHRIASSCGIPLVVDAAAAMGSLDAAGRPFGVGSVHPLIFSLHATKAFATAEGGLVYCADRELVATMRAMANFGFGEPRTATMPGLNAKLSEVHALLGLTKLEEYEAIAQHRQQMFERYRTLLPEFTFQTLTASRMAHQFVSVLVPDAQSGRVQQIIETLRACGIGAGRYFVPHLAEQPFFQKYCVAGDLPATEAISRRIVALPLSDDITAADVERVCEAFRTACQMPSRMQNARIRGQRMRTPRVRSAKPMPVRIKLPSLPPGAEPTSRS